MRSFLMTIILIVPVLLHADELSDEQAFVSHYTEVTKETREKLITLNEFIKTDKNFDKMREKKSVVSLSNDERQMLREAWGQLLFHHLTLNKVIDQINKRIEESGQKTFINEDYFTIQFAAFLAQYTSAVEFIRSMKNIPTTDKVLNETFDELGLEKRTFAKFKFEYLNIAKYAQFSGYRIQSLTDKNELSILAAGIKVDQSYLSKFNRYKGAYYTIRNAVKITTHLTYKLYFPFQKNISEWMGDERVARGNVFLINQEQIKKVHKMIKAGDVFIERREWYLSNIGLPGFWPHAALYLGRPEERTYLEEDSQVIEWVQSMGIESGSFEDLLKTKYPKVYAESLGSDETNHEYRVIEAMSEGVVFTSLEHSANADSLAVIRPKLSNVDIAKGILTSLKYKGRPYDFDFDFRTDSAVVCSELVYYAYQPTKDKNGIVFPVTETLGRPVVTPNNIIKEMAEAYGTDKQQFDFVLFLDGNDKKREATFSTMEALKTSWNRPKWFIFTQNKKK